MDARARRIDDASAAASKLLY